MLATIMTLTVLSMPAPARQPPESDARPTSPVYEVLQAADEATRRVQTVRYDVLVEGTGVRATRVPTSKGSVLMSDSGGGIPDIRVVGTRYEVEKLEGTVTRFEGVIRDGEALRVDHERGFIIRGGGGSSALGPGSDLIMREFDHPTPFQDEIRMGRATLEGRAYVHDVLCDVVLVQYRRDNYARWYFGAEDHLPRRVERLWPDDGQPGAIVMTLMNLETGFEVSPTDFEVIIPEGYQTKVAAPGSGLAGPGVRRNPDVDR